jgi:hypothetical protein
LARKFHPISTKEYRQLIGALNRRTYPKKLDELKFLGAGVDRTAYLLQVDGHESSVLKVQRRYPDRRRQNETELACALGGSPLAPEIYDWGPTEHPHWLEMEFLRPLKEEAFVAYTGVPFHDFASANDWLVEVYLTWDDAPGRKPFRVAEENRKLFVRRLGVRTQDANKTRSFAKQLIEIIEECGLDPAELERTTHWGIDAQGQLKLRDLGYAGKGSLRRLKKRLLEYNPRWPTSVLGHAPGERLAQ